jgi:hypothetical protein
VEDELAQRLARLDALLARVRTGPPAGAAAENAVARTLDTLAAATERLRHLAGEVARRSDSGAWDPVDRVTARLLMDDLSAALRGCREVAGTARRELDAVERALADVGRELA